MSKKVVPQEGSVGPFEFTRTPGTDIWSVDIPEHLAPYFWGFKFRGDRLLRIKTGPDDIGHLYKTACKVAQELEACEALDISVPPFGLKIEKNNFGHLVFTGEALALYRARSGVRSANTPAGLYTSDARKKRLVIKPEQYKEVICRMRAIEADIRARAERPLPVVPGVRFHRRASGDLIAAGEILVRMWWGSSKTISGCRRVNKYGDLEFSFEDEDRVVEELLGYQAWLAERAISLAGSDTVQRIEGMIAENRDALSARGAAVAINLPWVEVKSRYIDGWSAFFSPLNWVWCEEKKLWAADVGLSPKDADQWVWVSEAIRIIIACLPKIRTENRDETAE